MSSTGARGLVPLGPGLAERTSPHLTARDGRSRMGTYLPALHAMDKQVNREGPTPYRRVGARSLGRGLGVAVGAGMPSMPRTNVRPTLTRSRLTWRAPYAADARGPGGRMLCIDQPVAQRPWAAVIWMVIEPVTASPGRISARSRGWDYALRRWAWSLRRLWAVAASSHSLRQAPKPRRDMVVIFWQVLIWPNTGSTVWARSL
jgi:hypothetical protein